MKSNWPLVIEWIGLSEGGYVDHPKDPGGATNHGITKRVLEQWRGHKLTKEDVRTLTRKEAEEILKVRYWDLVKADDLPSGVDYAIADYGVNSGPSKAGKDAQRTLRDMGFTLKVDGLIGPETLGIFNSLSEQRRKEFIRMYCERRMAFLKKLKTFGVFGKGWTKRVMGQNWGAQTNDIGVIDRATMLASKNPVSNIPAPISHGTAKAEPEKANLVDALQKPEAWGPLAGLLSALGATTQGDGPFQWALSALVLAFIAVGVFYAVRAIKNADPA